MKQASLGVLLLMAALLTACSSEDKAQPDAASREQPKTWKLCVQANKDDGNITRGVHFVSEVLKSKWDANQTVEVYNESDALVGTLHAAASDDGSTIITGDISGSYTANTSKLYLYSPSKTRDYSGQTGTIESMSAKDYVSAEITVTAVDGSNGVLATSEAAFLRLQSFNKFTVTPAMHTLHVVAEGMSPVTTTLSGTTDGTEFYVALPSTGGSAKSFTFMGRTNDNVVYTCSKTKQLVDGNYYSGSITLQDPGMLPGKFSVAANKKVYFSQGNLQYQASTSTWRFAEHQWDYVGDGGTTGGNVIGSDNAQISSTYDGWIDLFGWGTSGYQFASGYGTAYQPWSSTNTMSMDYGPTDPTFDLTGTYANGDWGSNAISNGGNSAGLWRTLTKDEWLYLFGMTGYTDASGHARYRKYFRATVNSVQGIVVLPDDISGISDIPAESSRGTSSTFDGKTYTTSAWSALESAGAVFLPAAGRRPYYDGGTTVEYAGSAGDYWSSSTDNDSFPGGVARYAYSMFFYSDSVVPASGEEGRKSGYSVRLARLAQ